jgi:beta-lactam-binding protein with PASTA domain
MLKFLFSKKFLINLAIAIIIIILIVWGIFKFIDSYTNHGETISVPPLEGLTISEVEEIINEKKLRYIILDSIYISEAEKGVVLDQDPLTGDLVKENRTIYITTSKIAPPKSQIPLNIIGNNSTRIAIAKLESLGFKIGKLKRIPSVDANVVLSMDIKGKEITNGEWVSKNSVINLTFGGGLSGEKILVPYLINLTKQEAEGKLLEASLNIGFSDYENCETKEDSLKARVFKQTPARSKTVVINMGSSVDLYLTCDSNKIIYDANLDSLTLDSSRIDTTNND